VILLRSSANDNHYQTTLVSFSSISQTVAEGIRLGQISPDAGSSSWRLRMQDRYCTSAAVRLSERDVRSRRQSHPSEWPSGRAHSIALRGVARTPTQGPYTYIKPIHRTVGRIWTWKPAVASVTWGHVTSLSLFPFRLIFFSRRMLGMLGVIARTCPPGPNDRRPENGTNDRPKVPVSAPRGTSIACVRACVSRLAEFRASGLAAIIGPRKRQLIGRARSM